MLIKSKEEWIPVDFNGLTVINEGISTSKNSTFVFDFNNDDSSDIISLTNPSIHSSTINNVIEYYYFGYQFNKDVSSSIRSQFIHHLKFDDMTKEKEKFIHDSIIKFNRIIPIQQFEYIIYPESSSDLTHRLVMELSNVVLPDFSVGTIEMVKSMPKQIEFDYDRYEMQLRTAKNKDGKKKYGNESMIQNALKSVKEQMDKIHNLDYFSITKNIKGKYKNYLSKYYHFKTKKDENIYKALKNGKVLIVDDIMTSGVTLLQLFKAVKVINPSITPIVFTLLGKDAT